MEQTAVEKKCGNCVHFCTAWDEGEWRFNPPVVITTNRSGFIDSVYPSVSSDNWCGKFEPCQAAIDDYNNTEDEKQLSPAEIF